MPVTEPTATPATPMLRSRRRAYRLARRLCGRSAVRGARALTRSRQAGAAAAGRRRARRAGVTERSRDRTECLGSAWQCASRSVLPGVSGRARPSPPCNATHLRVTVVSGGAAAGNTRVRVGTDRALACQPAPWRCPRARDGGLLARRQARNEVCVVLVCWTWPRYLAPLRLALGQREQWPGCGSSC